MEPRIVSLLASATEIVHALGLGPHQVARSHECDFPPAVLDLPVCTRPRIDTNGSSGDIDRRVKAAGAGRALSIYDVLEDQLRALRPTHIITQDQCEVCAVSLKDVEAALAREPGFAPRVVTLRPDALADVWNDIRAVAAALGARERGAELVERLRGELDALAARGRARGGRPRLACIEWLEPLMAAGNWMPELVALAGAENLFGQAGRHSPWLTWEALRAADPEVILALPCGFDLERTASEMRWLVEREGWSELRAVRAGRVYIADGNQYFNRPGPRLVDSLRILLEILEDRGASGEGWRRWS